jgi:hypothetical protein
MHTPALFRENDPRNFSPGSTLTPVLPASLGAREVPLLVHALEWIDALGRTVFLALGSRRPGVPAGLIDLKRSWDESDLDTDEFSEWVSSFTLSGEDFLDWCEDCGGPHLRHLQRRRWRSGQVCQSMPRRQLRHMRLTVMNRYPDPHVRRGW